jgi:hypothetical protein
LWDSFIIYLYSYMKKVWLIISLLFTGLLLTGCNKTAENPEISDNCTIQCWEDKSIADIEESISEDVEEGHIKSSSDKEYYLNIDYQIKSWDNYIMQKYTEDPTETSIYLNSFDREYVWIAEMEWNVLLTWYLENKMVPEAFYYETQEEMDNAPKVENWYIKYYRNWDNNPQTLNLWFMRENIMPGWKWEDAKAIISLGYYRFPTRIDSIYHFHWEELPWEMYGNNLYHFVNDWKVHTFRLEIQWPPFEWEWWYAESVIKNWEILD